MSFHQLQLFSVILASLAVLCSSVMAEGVGTSQSFHGPTGLQLYSLRDMQKAEGVGAALDKAKEMGFKYVELASLGDLSPSEYKAELDKRGLVPIARFYRYKQLRDDLDGAVQDAKIFELPYAGCVWIDHKGPFDEKECREAIAVFNRAGEEFAKHGIKFYYHNHGYEFQPFGDGTLFDLMARETDPKNVSFQMDVLWTVLPGQDPVKLLEKYPDRWVLMHMKDLRKGVPLGTLSGGTELINDVAIGTGQVDWPAVLRAAQKVGIKYFFIEDESPTVLEQVPQSLKYLESVEW